MNAFDLAALHSAAFITPRPWSEAELAALLADPLIFAMTTGDPLAGFALGRSVAGEAELLTLAVAPMRRRQGLARDLLEVFEERAVQSGATDAFLEVAADNSAAIALYDGAGWQRHGMRRGYYRQPDGARIDALVMGKRLTLR